MKSIKKTEHHSQTSSRKFNGFNSPTKELSNDLSLLLTDVIEKDDIKIVKEIFDDKGFKEILSPTDLNRASRYLADTAKRLGVKLRSTIENQDFKTFNRIIGDKVLCSIIPSNDINWSLNCAISNGLPKFVNTMYDKDYIRDRIITAHYSPPKLIPEIVNDEVIDILTHGSFQQQVNSRIDLIIDKLKYFANYSTKEKGQAIKDFVQNADYDTVKSVLHAIKNPGKSTKISTKLPDDIKHKINIFIIKVAEQIEKQTQEKKPRSLDQY